MERQFDGRCRLVVWVSSKKSSEYADFSERNEYPDSDDYYSTPFRGLLYWSRELHMSRITKLFSLIAIAAAVGSGPVACAQHTATGRTSRTAEVNDLRSNNNSTRRSQVQAGQAKRLQAEERAQHADRVQTTGTVQRTSYVPRHLRQDGMPATVQEGEIIDTPQPRAYYGDTVMESEPVGSGCTDCGTDTGPDVGGDWLDGGCDSCGCPPGDACGCPRPRCWIDCLGGLFTNSEFFVGSQAYQGYGLEEDSGFGFHGGFNTGMPLNWLTCGLFSAQVGVNAVYADLASSDNSATKEQMFYTAGFFRRVDYGLQGGVVADVLDASSEFDPRVVQIRGELSWAYPSHHLFGFRFGRNVQDHDDETQEGILRKSLDNYRLFYQVPGCNGGFSEVEAGWTDEGNALVGSRFDIPFNQCWALRSGFTYVIPDAADRDGWNIFLGMSFRPRGAGWYDFYHRPMFDVADNGSMMLTD